VISVVIPIRNGEKTIRAAVDSVLSQELPIRESGPGFERIEVICVLNGTTDNTESILLNEYGSDPLQRVRICSSSPGIVPALNEGLRNATGEFIARQDADDVWLPGKIKAQIEFLSANPEVDILGTQMDIVDPSVSWKNYTHYPEKHDEIVGRLLQGDNSIGHPSVMFRRRVLDKCAGYTDLFPLAEDLELWLRAAAWYKFANLPERLVRYTHVHNPKYNPKVPQTLAAWYRMIYGIR
jgi:glycosyltransferase involved in cell wall biosynthesis